VNGDRNVELSGKLGTISEPLGISKTTVEELKICAFAVRTASGEENTACRLEGTVTIAQMILTTKILFDRQMPAVVEICLSGADDKISLSELIKEYLGFPWPDYLDITLYEGSICYSPQEVWIQGKLYKKGFCASPNTKIFALPPIVLSVLIDAEDIEASARFKEPIDLFIVRFSLPGREDPETEDSEVEKGPRLSILTGKESRFSLSSDVTFLQTPLGRVDASVRKNGMQGSLSFPAQCPISGTARFEWNEKGFMLKECPIGLIPELDFDLPKVNFRTSATRSHTNTIPQGVKLCGR